MEHFIIHKSRDGCKPSGDGKLLGTVLAEFYLQIWLAQSTTIMTDG